MAVKYNAEIFGDTYPLKSDDHDVNYLTFLMEHSYLSYQWCNHVC